MTPMDSRAIKTEINEYLGAEFGVGGESDPPDENWPFELEYVGRVDDADYYRFDCFGDIYYATWSSELLCYDSAENIDSSEVGAQLRPTKHR